MISLRKLQTFTGLVLALACASACGASNPNAPAANQASFSRSVDSANFVAPDFVGATQTLTYPLTTTVSVFEVTHTGTMTSGQGTVIIRDGAAAQVYSGDLRTIGAFHTSSGVIGTWEIEVRLTNASGTFGFSVRKA